MSLDLVKLDAMISSDSLPKVDRLRNVEETGHRTEFMSGAGVYFNSATSISNIGSYPTSNAIGSSFEGSSSSVRKSSTRRFNGVGFRNAVKDDIALPRATLAGRQTSSNTRSVPSLHARRNKIQPKVSDATWDIETLQELVMSYKRKVSELEKAQRLLRCQYQKTQERLVSKDREIDAILQKVAGGAALSSEKCLVKTLKHQVRTLQEMLSEKGAEFERLRSTLKNTQMEEMRIYCDDFAQEVRRLRLFNELGRTPENHVSISALEEIRSLRQECSALRHNNVELTNRLTQTELNAEQTRANDRKQFAERILKMETELRQERALVTEMEKIGDLTRAELAQVVSQTDTTRSALADSSAQIRLLKERLASLEMELAAQKAAAAVASEKSSKDFYDLLALKDSMEKKLFAEIKDLNDALEKQGSANAILRESERVLQGSVTDLKRILEETKESAQKEQQRLLEKLQKNENQIDALGVENRTVHADLSSIRSELELSSKSLRQSQQNYEDAKTELFALEKELAKTRADAEKLAADRNAELQLQMAELQSHQEEVARLRALHEQSSKKFHEMLKESAVPSANGTTDNEASKPTADNDIRKPEEILEANNIVGSPANNAFSDTAPTQSNDSKLADLPPNADVSVVEKSSAEPLADSQQVEDAKQENDSEKKPKVPREASSKPDGSKSKSNHEREDKHSKSKGHDKTEKDKDRSDKSGTKSEKKSDKKSSPKR